MATLKQHILQSALGRQLVPLREKWLRRPALFDRELRQHMSAVDLNRLAASEVPAVSEFAREGMAVLRQIHDPSVVQAVHKAVFGLIERVRAGERNDAWDVVAYPHDGIYRIRRIHETCAATAPLLNHRAVLDVVRSYTGAKWRYTAYVDYKPDLIHDATTVPHADTWRRQVKAFTLLNDVGPANAPFVYWARSHRDGHWRRHFDYLLWSNDYIGSGGVYPPHVLRDRVDAGELREVEVTGRAGDVIVATTRGPHRASNLREGYRLQLVEVFDPE